VDIDNIGNINIICGKGYIDTYNMPTHIILLSGHYGSGKDTLADFIEEVAGISDFSVGRFSFGGALKDIVVALTDTLTSQKLERSKMDALEYKENTVIHGCDYRLRQLLQVVGTDILRKHLGDDVFARKTVEDIGRFVSAEADANKGHTKVAVVTDLRFPNELACVKSAFGGTHKVCVIRIVRTNTSSSSHISESFYNDIPYDYLVENNGTVDELRILAKKLICNFGVQ